MLPSNFHEFYFDFPDLIESLSSFSSCSHRHSRLLWVYLSKIFSPSLWEEFLLGLLVAISSLYSRFQVLSRCCRTFFNCWWVILARTILKSCEVFVRMITVPGIVPLNRNLVFWFSTICSSYADLFVLWSYLLALLPKTHHAILLEHLELIFWASFYSSSRMKVQVTIQY